MAPTTTNDNEGQPHVPIAICGIGTRLPGGIRNADQLWESIVNEHGSHGPVRLDDHDLKKGPRPFDASIFSMTDEEANNCSPQQQKLLEVTRECFEDACEVNYRGEDACVGCYVGTADKNDASMISSKNELKGPRFVFINHVLSSYVTRLLTSHFLDSVMTNSSLVAFHEACCAVRSGTAKSAIFVASNVLPASENGAEKSEAVSAVYIKALPDAIRDGNPIRAVIRASTASSAAVSHDQNAATEAFEKLIREAHATAGLDPRSTLLVQVSNKNMSL